MRYTHLMILLAVIISSSAYAQNPLAGITQRAIADRMRSANRVWEYDQMSRVRDRSHNNRRQPKINVGEELKEIGVGWIAGEVLGRQANSLANEREWNEARVDDWRDQRSTDRRIQHDWARTDQRIVLDQSRHGMRNDSELLRANERAYEYYLRDLPQGVIPMTFQQFLGSSAMPQMISPVEVVVQRPPTTRYATATPGVVTTVVQTTTAVATTPVAIVTGSGRISSAEETRRRYGR